MASLRLRQVSDGSCPAAQGWPEVQHCTENRENEKQQQMGREYRKKTQAALQDSCKNSLELWDKYLIANVTQPECKAAGLRGRGCWAHLPSGRQEAELQRCGCLHPELLRRAGARACCRCWQLSIMKDEPEEAELILHEALRLAIQSDNKKAIIYTYDLMANLAFIRGRCSIH
ncbi:hypothetical protein QTO34_000552 [Cnephaeus nilssonii]|uniref:Uncharacterized protein n=1 Tax=Cnephaeus nilssonii TaxID=3371016 RepID=A0AA40ICP4_CNENI|nr:hypothetical protein QTO34_000552 [Eptesicus nilssonii]